MSPVLIFALPKHLIDLQNDYKMMQSSIICIQETWCPSDVNSDALQINGFNLHLINHGKGKGIATYFKSIFCFEQEINNEKFQMALFSSKSYHVINVYRSQGAETSLFIHNLNFLIRNLDDCTVVGDFNIDYLNTSHPIFDFLLSNGFSQLVKCATHEQGSLLDCAFVKSLNKHDFDLTWPYYSDHAGICVVALV